MDGFLWKGSTGGGSVERGPGWGNLLEVPCNGSPGVGPLERYRVAGPP
jgi:hypothetical protein